MFLHLTMVNPCLSIWNIWPWKYAHNLENCSLPENYVCSCNYAILKDIFVRFRHDILKTYTFRKCAIRFSLSALVWPLRQGQIWKYFRKLVFVPNFAKHFQIWNQVALLYRLMTKKLHLTLTLFQGHTLQIIKKWPFKIYNLVFQ